MNIKIKNDQKKYINEIALIDIHFYLSNEYLHEILS
jgi:hypothetical protein